VVVYAVVGIPIYAVLIKKGKKLISKEYWSFTLKFNIPLIPHYLSQTILNQADRIMINNMCSTAQAGIYGLAYNAGMLMNILTSAINSAFIPWMYRQLKEKKEKSIGEKANYILLILAILVVCMMLFAPELVRILGSKDYYEAVYIVPPVAGSVFFIFLFSLFANVELFYEKNIWVMAGSFIAAIINLILNYFFIKKFGYLAAGYTTLVSYVIISVVHYIFMKAICRKMKAEGNIYDMRMILPLSIFMVVVSCTVPLLYGMWVIRYAVILLVALGVFVKRNAIIAFVKSMKKKEDKS
jgi:O-antigen/teichoic acid export membrane protein